MGRKHHTEVLIIGAGPVGLFAAAELTKRDIDVQIIDKDWWGTGFSYALALHPESLELLEDLDLDKPMVESGYKVDRIAFYEGHERRLDLDLAAVGGKHPYLTVLPQNQIESSLEGWLKKHKVKVQWNHRLTKIASESAPIDATVERWGMDYSGYSVPRRIPVVEKEFVFRSEFLLGTDGYKSIVRQQVDANYDRLEDPDLFIVFEFQCDTDLAGVATIILNEETSSALWPLPDGRCRWSFQLPDRDEFPGERIKSRLSEAGHWTTPGLSQDRLESLIAERAPWFKGHIDDLIWSSPIKFEHRLASHFGIGDLWLAGDSAHLVSPLGIHSMNVGLREARDLAEILTSILRQNAPRSNLVRYAHDRKAEWSELLDVNHTLHATPEASPFVRKNARRILPCIPSSGPGLRVLMSQIGLEFNGEPGKASG